ncbi:MAG: eIF2A-related protein, partial [Cyclobacteriaceae bacterium]
MIKPFLFSLLICVIFFSCEEKKNNKQEALAPKLVLPIGHTNNVRFAEFSKDGRLVVTASDDKTAKIWEASSGKLLHSLEGHSREVNTAQFSADGQYVVTTASYDSTASIWQTNSGKLLHSLKGHSGWVVSAQFSADGQYIVTASSDGSAKIWQANSGQLLHSLEGHSGEVESAQFSADGQYVVTASYDSTAKIWQTKSGKLLHSLEGHSSRVSSAQFSTDSQYIVTTASNDSTSKIWEAKSGKLLHSLEENSWEVNTAQFNADGQYVVTTAVNDSTAKIWQTISGQLLHSLEGHFFEVVSAQFSPDGQYIITASKDNTAKIWQTNSGKLLHSLEGHSGEVNSAQFSTDGQYIVTASSDGTAKIWETKSGKLLHSLQGHSSGVSSAQFSAGGQYMVTASDNTVKIWQTNSGKLIHPLEGHSSGVSSVQFSTDSQYIVTASLDGTANLWQTHSGNILHSLEGHSEKVNSAQFSADGQYMVTASNDYTAKIWQTNSGKLLHSLEGHSNSVKLAEFNADGQYVVTASLDGTAKIWQTNSGQLLHSLEGHSGEVDLAQFSADGQYIVTASIDDTAKIWQTNSGKLLHALEGHSSYVNSAQFSADGQYIVTASTDATAKIWQTNSGKLLHSLEGHSQWVHTAKFSPDGQYIVTASGDNTAKIWETKSGKEVKSMPIAGDNIEVNKAFTTILSRNNATTSLYDIATGKELLSWISVDSSDWVVTHPSGLFDASQSAMDKLYFVQGLDIIDFAQLKERYYEPGLWKKVMSGEKLREVTAFKSIELPPDIEQDKDDDFGVANLTFENREGGIGQISVTLNGLEVMEDIRPSGFNPKKKSWEYELKLSALPNLKKGEENLIEVRAWNEGHWVISRPLQIKFTPASTRGAVAEVEESKEKKAIPNIHILTCGVSDYTGNAIDLKYATKDAESMAKALQLGASKLVGTGKTFVYSLTDNSTLKPTKANIQKTFAEISKKSSPNDVFVVYLSGHGINWGGDNGDFYYLTSDAYSTELQAYNDPAIRTNATLSSKELIELFKTVPSDKRVLMIDACASGKMVQNLVASRDISSSTLRALDRLRDRTGFHIITGCAADAVSYEASRFGQGVLTYSLIEGIKGASLKENKFVDINMLFQHAKERVPELAKGIGGIQSPQVFSPQGAQSFDIGELDDEIKKQIPLPKTRPVFVRSTFINDQTLDDTDDLETLLDEALNELSSKGEKASILFMDIQKYDEGCKISGKYKKANGLITATYKIKCDGKEQIKTVTGKTAKE